MARRGNSPRSISSNAACGSRTSLSSGQATTGCLLRLLTLPACHSGAASILLHNLHRNHPLTASLHDLPPPLRTDPQTFRDLHRSGPQPQQLLPPRMQLPPGGGHLDQEALVAKVVIHLPVGIGAGIGPERSTLRREAPGGLEDAEHGDLLQVFPWVAGTARDVGRHGLGDVAVLQRQGIGSRVGIDRPMTAWTAGVGEHQLHRLLAAGRPGGLGRSLQPRHAGRHHGWPKRQVQLACC